MTPEDIKSLLIKRGKKQVAIAIELKVSPAAVSRVIKGITKSRRIKQAIAEALNEKVEDLWTDSSESEAKHISKRRGLS